MSVVQSVKYSPHSFAFTVQMGSL